MKVAETNPTKIIQPAGELLKESQGGTASRRKNTASTTTPAGGQGNNRSIVKESKEKKEVDETAIEERNHQDADAKKKEAKKNRGILRRQFELIIELLKLRKVPIERAYLEVAVSLCLVILSYLRRYEELLGIHYTIADSNLTTATKVLSYIDIFSLMKISISIYNVALIAASAFLILLPLLYVVCASMHAIYPHIKVRKFFYGRWFVLAGEAFLWLLLQPLAMILVSYITCPDVLVNNIGLQCSSADNLRVLKLALVIAGLAMTVVSLWFFSYFFFNGGFSTKKDALACDNTVNILLFSIYKLLFSVMITLSFNSYAFFICLIVFNLVSSGFLAFIFNFHSGLITFRHKYVRDLFQILILLLFSQSAGYAIDELIRIISEIGTVDKNNSIQITAIVAIMMIFIVYQFTKSEELRFIMSSDLKGLSYIQFKKKIYYLQHLLEDSLENIHQDAFFKGILSQHLTSTCFHEGSSIRCFCKLRGLHDSKKNKDVPLDKYFLSSNRNILSKFIVKSWYQQYLILNPQDFSAVIDYSEFIFNKLRNSCLSLTNVAFLKTKFLYPTDSFRLFRLFQYIYKVNRKKNVTSYKTLLDVENVIPVEMKIERIKYKIKRILSSNADFWGMLLKNIVNLEECNQAIKKILEEIEAIKVMWKRVIVYLNYREKWRFYFAWYTLYILNQKVSVALMEKFSGNQVNENEVFFEEFQTDQLEDDVGSVASNAKDDQDKINIKKLEMAFDRRSSVFRVSNDANGKIIKVNKPVLTTFGFTRYELENHLYVTDLMPRSFAILHPRQTSHFITTGKSKILYSQKEIYCVMKKGNLFSAWKFLKLYVTSSGDTEFVALIRPIMNPPGSKVNYLIINEDWEVDSMTQQVYELFMIDAQLYRQHMVQLANFRCEADKNLETGRKDNKIALANLQSTCMVLNILLLIPKLLKFSKFAQFLTPDDQLHFGITHKKENLGGIFNMFRNNDKKRFSMVQHPDKQGGLNQKHIDKLKQMTLKKNTSQPQQSNDETNQKNNILGGKQKNLQDDQEQDQRSPLNSNRKSQNASAQNLTMNDSISHLMVGPNSGNPNINSSPSTNPAVLGNKQSSKKLEDLTGENSPNLELNEEFVKQDSLQPASSASFASIRRSSLLEMQEQLHGNLKGQEEIRKIIDKAPLKKKTYADGSQGESEGDESNKHRDGSQTQDDGDDDFESDYGFDQYDQNGKKLIDERLERGDQIPFVARVPINIQQMMASYFIMCTSRMKKFEESEQRKDMSVRRNSMKSSKSPSLSSRRTSFKEVSSQNLTMGASRKASEIAQKEEAEQQYLQRDKAMYQLLKDVYSLHARRKKVKQFQLVCSIKFKKVGNRKIGVMKFLNLEEVRTAKALLLQQQQQQQQYQQQQQQQAGNKQANNNNNLNDSFSYIKQTSLSKEPSSIILPQVAPASLFRRGSANQLIPQTSGLSVFGNAANNPNDKGPKNLNNISIQQFATPASNTPFSLRPQLNPLNSQISGQLSFQEVSETVNTPELPREEDNYEISKENGMGYQVNYLSEEEDHQPPKDIQKDFEKKQGSVTFSLSSADNIFIKEDIHQPRSRLRSIFQMQLFTRVVFLLIVSFNIFTCFLGVNTYFSTINTESQKLQMAKKLHLQILSGYNNMLDQLILNANNLTDSNLATTFYQSQANLQDAITGEFIEVTNYFENIISNKMLQQVLFDSSLFQTQISTSYILPTSPGQGNYTFDTSDLFQAYIYHINELNNSIATAALAQTILVGTISVDFIRANVFQYLNDYIDSIGSQSIDLLSSTMSSISSFTLIVVIVLSVLIVVSLILIWRFMRVICDSFTSIFESFEKMDILDVHKIRNYNLLLLSDFSYAVDKDEFYSKIYLPITNQLREDSDEQKDADPASNMNNRFLGKQISKTSSGIQPLDPILSVNQLEQNPMQTLKINQISQNATTGILNKNNLENNLAIPKNPNNYISVLSQNISKRNNGRFTMVQKIQDLNLEASEDNVQTKKNRTVEQGKFLVNLEVRTLIFYGAFALSVITFSLAYFLLVYLNESILQDIRKDGLIIAQPITLDLVMLISLKENLIDPVNYRNNLYTSGNDLINQFFQVKQDTVLSGQSQYAYNYMYTDIYKNDACDSQYVSILITQPEIQDCTAIAQKTLVGGLNIFQTRYTEFLADFKSIAALTAYTLPTTFFQSLIEFSRGVYYAKIFNIMILDQWVTDLMSNVSSIETSSSVLVIAAGAFILILFVVLNEVLILGRFREEYDYFRTVYKMYFPEAVVTKKKNIKYWLIKQGILKRK